MSVQRASEAAWRRFLTIGTTAASSAAAVAIADGWPQVYRRGRYPTELWQRGRAGRLAIGSSNWPPHPKVRRSAKPDWIAYWDFTPFELQRELFDRHLRLAQRLDLPFIVHMRDCGEATVEMLRRPRERGPLRGVMHSFTGDLATARAVPGARAPHQFCRHGDVQEVGRTARDRRQRSLTTAS